MTEKLKKKFKNKSTSVQLLNANAKKIMICFVIFNILNLFNKIIIIKMVKVLMIKLFYKTFKKVLN